MEQVAQAAKTTPKDFFLWAGAMASLYGGVIAFITLLFEYIHVAFPDVLENGYYYGDPYSGPVRFAMASLIVLVPLFLVLMRLIRRDIARDSSRADVWIRRWALYLTLFIAGATMAGDLITLVNYFLNGEVTMRFALKVLVVLLVAGAGFLHFLADLRGYWIAFPQRANMVGYGVLVAVLASLIAGFIIIGTPGEARLYRFDEVKAGDLSNIQYQVVSYWQQKGELPATLAELTDPISSYIAPKDPQTNESYGYRVVSPMSFELCADFNAASRNVRGVYGDPSVVRQIGSDSWDHAAGKACFTRTIDPDLYPPVEKTPRG